MSADNRVMPVQVSVALEKRITAGVSSPVIRLLPWALFSGAIEIRCQAQHGKSLVDIAKAGGLDARQLVALFCDTRYAIGICERDAHRILLAMLMAFNTGWLIGTARVARSVSRVFAGEAACPHGLPWDDCSTCCH